MPIYTLILAICFSVNAFAGDGHDHEHRHHDAHEHGVGEFNLATDGQKLIIEIELPAHDVVGFEHEARTKEQKRAVNAAVEKLKIAGQNVSIPSRANCKADAAAKVESGLIKNDKGHEHHVDGHHDDGHHDHDHKGHHDEDHASGEGHSEFSIQYTYKCSDINKLTQVEVQMFKNFSRMKKLKVQALTASGSVSVGLTPKQSVINLGQ